MKNTSRILLVLTLAMIVVFACIIGVMQMNIAYAAEESEVIAEATETTAETPTFSGRVTKWFEDNIVPFLSTVNLGFIMSCVFFVIKAWKNNKTSTKLTVDNLSLNTESNNEVVKVVNKMIGSYNKSIEGMDELRKDYKELKKMYDEAVAFSKATLDILSTVYANNKNLPQGVKDLVAIKYATALKGEVTEVKENSSEE
jgi:hypothetical protein